MFFLRSKGVLLLELLISLALIFCMLPFIYQSFFQIQKSLNQLFNINNKQTEISYVDYFLREDLKQITAFSNWNNNLLSGQTADGTIIKYYCQEKTLKRYFKRINTKASTTIMTKLTELKSFNVKKSNHLLELDLQTDIGTKNIMIYLENEN